MQNYQICPYERSVRQMHDFQVLQSAADSMHAARQKRTSSSTFRLVFFVRLNRSCSTIAKSTKRDVKPYLRLKLKQNCLAKSDTLENIQEAKVVAANSQRWTKVKTFKALNLKNSHVTMV